MGVINFTTVPREVGRKRLFALDTQDKNKILRDIRKDWKKLIDLHFRAEGGITQTNAVLSWRDLSEDYEIRKDREYPGSGILERQSPTLATRYKSGIRFSSSEFRITINYPGIGENIRGPLGSRPNAGIHQLGAPQRRIILSGFKKIARDRIIKFFTD